MRRTWLLLLLLACAAVPSAAQTQVFSWSYSSTTTNFDFSIAGPGDLNGDGIPDVVIGTWGLGDCVTARSGYDGSILWQVCESNPLLQLGRSVAGAGDVDLDGRPDVVVALPGTALVPGATRILSGATGTVIRNIAVATRVVDGGKDFDGDGIPDQLGTYAFASGPGGAGVHVFSGATGAIVFTQDNAWCSCDVRACFIGDVNADGLDDLVVSFIAPQQTTLGAVAVLKGSNGALHAMITPPSVNEIIGVKIADLGDLTGDGQPEVGITSGPSGGSQRLSVFNLGSGGTIPWSSSLWSVLPQWAPSYSTHLSNPVGIADRTGDGQRDVALKATFVAFPAYTTVSYLGVLAGSTGAPFSGFAANDLGALAAAGDLNADGFTEVISASGVTTDLLGVSTGTVEVVSSAALAVAPPPAVLLGGCGANPPSLGATPLKIGQPFTLFLGGAAPAHTVDFVLDVAPPAPFLVGGCTWHPNLAHVGSWFVFPAATGATGTVGATIPVPSIPTAAGTAVTIQAIVYGTTSPLGFDLSNGLLATAGF